ncbi:DUF2252 domain-containing protein [Paraburkholderia azotifigens]|uniref:DUF2252 domain-containing protein n=1 Tax=Paraburkholderia azotifigens TaxID=2057004 RepID=A0A5C6V325_9BURK|nr:DUF2252 domain-containing protein [Paraburkholderia azotifigens]TXC79374.1 DUF2252 domain-containing protein [Paraburkholderia azotifigens]
MKKPQKIERAAAPAESGGAVTSRRVPRSQQSEIGNVDRDPVELLKLSSADRVERLVPLRYGRMLASPFAFFRGSAIIQAHDLAGTPDSGLVFQICGDCHLANFGGFATPERRLLFDLNDFDETSEAPWEWDIKRLVVSFVLAARNLGFKQRQAEELVYAVAQSYQSRMQAYAEMSILETWYEQITLERVLAESTEPEVQRRVRRAMERASTRTHESLLPKLTRRDGDRLIILDAPPAVFHIRGEQTLFSPDDELLKLKDLEGAQAAAFSDYLSTLALDRRRLLGYFTFQDLAFKVVGVGSVGTRCVIVLMMDRHDKPLFLQFKEASQSVIARYRGKRKSGHEGQRVVEGQRLMQAASDPFLGWAKGPLGRHFYARQLRDMKLSPQIELMDADMLARYGGLCGWVLARAHAKASGLAAEISDYFGRSDRMSEALIAYSNRYADQVEHDYARFAAACRSGQLEARTDEDMAADFRI